MKITNGAAPAVITLLVAAGLTYIGFEGKLTAEIAAAGFLALLGTFAGAYLAFNLQERKESLKETERRQQALNRALLVLGAQQNAIHGFAKAMRRYTSHVERATNLEALQPPESFQLRQNLEELMFLTDTNTPNLVMDLYLEQERFDQAMYSIRMRNYFYVTRFQPAIAGKGLNFRRVELSEIKEAVGEFVYDSIIQITAGMYAHVYGSEKSIPEVFANLRKTAKHLYPEEKFLRFDVIEPLPPADV